MKMSFSIINIILFLAAAQGLLLAVLIFQKYRRLFANRFLGSIMLLYSLLLIQMLLTDLGFDRKFPHLMIVPLGISLLIGPLHYLYTKSLIQSWTKIKKSEWFHFLPFVIYEISIIPQFFKPANQLIAEMQKVYVEGFPLRFIIFNWFILILSLTYLLLTAWLLIRYTHTIKNVFSTIEKIRLDWLRNITYMGIFVVLVFLLENILLLFGIELSHFFNITSIVVAIFIYLMGYLGLLKSEIFAEPTIAESIRELPDLQYQKIDDQQPRYEKSGLSPDRAKQHLDDLLHLMEQERPYINSDLTLTQLAEMLSITPHNLSEILNTRLNQNFFDFINHYRIEEVKKALIDPQKQHLTVLAIGLDAGFNSKTSFNTTFKKYTEMTPSEYRNKLLG